MPPLRVKDYDLLVIGESSIEFQCEGDIVLADTFVDPLQGIFEIFLFRFDQSHSDIAAGIIRIQSRRPFKLFHGLGQVSEFQFPQALIIMVVRRVQNRLFLKVLPT